MTNFFNKKNRTNVERCKQQIFIQALNIQIYLSTYTYFRNEYRAASLAQSGFGMKWPIYPMLFKFEAMFTLQYKHI